MRKIYCLGETVYDIIFKNNQPVAAKAGGSMLNSTVSMGKILLPVHFISEYGSDDIGNEIDFFLKSYNVNTEFVYRYAEGKTSIAIAFLNDKSDARYTFYKDLPENRMDIKLPAPTENDIILFGSFYALNREIREQIVNFIGNAKKAGAIIIYDPNFRKAHLHELSELIPFIVENMQMASIIRGSNEDFQMIFNAGTFEEAYDCISKYCSILVYTMNAEGVNFKTPDCKIFQKVPKLNPISTIGSGDNFNAGIIYGLMKEHVNENKLLSANDRVWQKIINYGIDFATDVCMSYDNYISDDFAIKIKSAF